MKTARLTVTSTHSPRWHTTYLLAASLAALSAAAASAQTSSVPSDPPVAPPFSLSTVADAALSHAAPVALSAAAAATEIAMAPASPEGGVSFLPETNPVNLLEAPARRPPALIPLYVSLASLQAWDTALTLRGIRNGAREVNPAMAGVVKSPPAFIAMKAGVTAASVIAAEGFRKRHPVASVVLLAAVNSAYAVIVTHNYRVTRR
jgi:hypothetical protein